MNIFNLLLAFSIIIITFTLQKKYSFNLKKSITTLLIGLFLALTVLIYPLSEGSVIDKLIYAIIYSAQTILLGEDVSLITNLNNITLLENIYVISIYILLLAMPLLTATFLASVLNGISAKIKLHFISKKEIIIFSELNEKSITIAEKINSKENVFIFANCQNETDLDEKLKKLKAIKLSQNVNDINIEYIKSNNITLYILTKDKDKGLNEVLSLIDKYSQKPLKIYFITNNNMAQVILDSADKGKIRLEIVEETERAVCQVLEEKPLYLNAVNNHIKVLLVGCGNVGVEFLKAITWCGQIKDYKLTITVLDKNASQIKEHIALNYPELLPNYNYNFIELDANSSKIEKALDQISNINYVVIALKSEEESLEVALNLRRYFALKNKEFTTNPIINVWIENPLKNKQINNLKNQKGSQYHISAFGSTKQLYYDFPIIDSKIEQMTKEVHFAYDNSKNLDNFYKKNYNIKSSRAFALHIKYKIYSVLKDKYTGNIDEDIKNFKKCLENKQTLDALIKNEHDRWTAYMRSDGYKLATKEEVNSYKNIIKSHVNSLAKLHPALTEYENLEEIEKEIGVPLKDKDKFIITKIPDIIACQTKENSKAIEYTPKPIDTKNIILSKEIMELSEKLAKNVHEVWAQNKLKEGWHYGVKTDAKSKTHSSLVPYEKLSESEKDYDRATLIESLKVLEKLGYKIEKRNNNEL